MLVVIDMLSYLLKRSGWARFVSTSLFFFSQIIATEFLLGIFSVLTSLNLVIFNILVTIAILSLLGRKFGKDRLRKYFSDLKSSVIQIKKLLLSDPLFLALVTLAVLFVGWVIFLGIIFPATDFDGNSYHLTFVANVIQNHSFFDVPTSLTWLNGYPKGGEFIQMWSVIIARNDMFSDLAQVPFMILGVYALYDISLRVGASKRNARFASVLFIFLPIVLNQLKTTYVDVMLSTLFFAAVAIVIKKKLEKIDYVLIGIIYSLLIAVKSTGFLFVAATVPLLFWNIYNNRSKKSGSFVSNYIKPALLMVGPTAFGLYWYVKNFVSYDTPIYPFGFKLLGKSIFPGQTFQEFAASAVNQTALPNGCAQRIWFVWTEQKDWFGCFYNYDSNYTGFGPIWFIVLLPAIALALYVAIKKRNYLFLAISASFAALFAIYPANYYSRYTIFITGVGILALAITLTYIHEITAKFVKVLSVILAVSVIGTNFVLCNYTPLVIKAQLKSLKHGSQRGLIYNNNPGLAYVTLENEVQKDDVVAYDSKPYFIYPLWKADFSNDVIFVTAQNDTEWYKNLNEKSVDYVFTVVYSKENKWAEEKLKTIYKDEMYEVFQVN